MTADGGPSGRDDDSADRTTESDVDGSSSTRDGDGGPSGRDVVVPMHVYKVVTVFSTLIAVLLVVGGLILLDLATDRGAAAREDVAILRATIGLVSIVLGAAVYAFASRFRAAGMGNPKDDHDESSNDGRRVR